MNATAWSLCQAIINLAAPSGRTRVRCFQPPWRTVWLYKCPQCGQERRVCANSFRGTNPVPSVGGIRCGAYLEGKS